MQGRSHSTQQDTAPGLSQDTQPQPLTAAAWAGSALTEPQGSWGGRDPEGTLRGPSATPATLRDIADGSKHCPTRP